MIDNKPTIQVVYAEAPTQGGSQYLVTLNWQPELTAMQAVAQSGLLEKLPAQQPLMLGIFGDRISDPAQYLMQAGDRLEIYRPLTCDPMTVRRKRAETNPVGRFKRKL